MREARSVARGSWLVGGVARALAALRGSAWWSLAPRAALGAAALGVLGLLGSGALDRWLPSPQGVASAAAAPPSTARASASASGAPSPSASSAPSASASASPSATPPATTGDGKIVLNLASEVDLVRLPGIGPKKARAILALRDKLGGRFKRLEDLLRVRGLKRKALERLRPHVVLDAPASPTPDEPQRRPP